MGGFLTRTYGSLFAREWQREILDTEIHNETDDDFYSVERVDGIKYKQYYVINRKTFVLLRFGWECSS